MMLFTFVIFLTDKITNSFLLNLIPQATPLEFGITIQPFQVTDNVTEVDIVARVSNVPNGFNYVDSFLNFLSFFLISFFFFIFKMGYHMFNSKNRIFKTVKTTFFYFWIVLNSFLCFFWCRWI